MTLFWCKKNIAFSLLSHCVQILQCPHGLWVDNFNKGY
jgi:hypothetical protein